jgi:hypothetical protein
MNWKSKQKELSLEEALKEAKKELTPYWIGSPPLLAPLEANGKITLHPLTDEFLTKERLILILNPVAFSSREALIYFNEWFRRYSEHSIDFLLILQSVYRFINQRDAFIKMLSQTQNSIPFAIDHDGALTQAFQAQSTPKLLFFKNGKVKIAESGPQWHQGIESELQQNLRIEDPGLPLLPPYRRFEKPIEDKPSFLLRKSSTTLFEKVSAEEVKHLSNHPEEPIALQKIYYTGEWEFEEERIQTTDPKAALLFDTPHSHVGMISSTLTRSIQVSKIAINLNSNTIPEVFCDKDVRFDDKGRSVIIVNDDFFFRALCNLPSGKRNRILLTFPSAKQVPLALYGLQFGS